MQDEDGRWSITCHFFGNTSHRPAHRACVAMPAHHYEIDVVRIGLSDDRLTGCPGRTVTTLVAVRIPSKPLVFARASRYSLTAGISWSRISGCAMVPTETINSVGGNTACTNVTVPLAAHARRVGTGRACSARADPTNGTKICLNIEVLLSTSQLSQKSRFCFKRPISLRPRT